MNRVLVVVVVVELGSELRVRREETD